MNKKLYIYDLDNTIVEKLNINYTHLRNNLKKLINNENESFRPLVIKMLNYKINLEVLDKYELQSVSTSKLKKNISDTYIKNIKNKEDVIILTRNSLILTETLLKFHGLPYPKKIIHRDTNINYQKPNIKVLDTINLKQYNNIIYYGDSWHDKELFKNIKKKFYNAIVKFIKVN